MNSINIPHFFKDYTGSIDDFRILLENLNRGTAPEYGTPEEQMVLLQELHKSFVGIHPNKSENSVNNIDLGEWIYYNKRYYHLFTDKNKTKVENDIEYYTYKTDIKDPETVELTREGATTLEELFYEVGEKQRGYNKSKLEAGTAKIDDEKIDTRIINPTRISSDIVAYDDIVIGNLKIPAGHKIRSGVFIEDIIRAMIEVENFPSPALKPQGIITGATNILSPTTIFIGDNITVPKIGYKITKGQFDYQQWAGDVNNNIPLDEQVIRITNISRTKIIGFNGFVNDSKNGDNEVELSNIITNINLGENKISSSYSGRFSPPVNENDELVYPYSNQMNISPRTGQDDAHNLIHPTRSSIWDIEDIQENSRVISWYQGVLPIYTNFEVSSNIGAVPSQMDFGVNIGSSWIAISNPILVNNIKTDCQKLRIKTYQDKTLAFSCKGGNPIKIYVPKYSNDIQVSLFQAGGLTAWVKDVNYTLTDILILCDDNIERQYQCINLGSAAGIFIIILNSTLNTETV